MYHANHGVFDPEDQWKPLPTAMREFLHMIPPQHTFPEGGKLGGRVQSEWVLENFSCSSIGNGFHVGVVAWVVSQGLAYHCLIDQTVTPGRLCRRFLELRHPGWTEVYIEKLKNFGECGGLACASDALVSGDLTGEMVEKVVKIDAGEHSIR